MNYEDKKIHALHLIKENAISAYEIGQKSKVSTQTVQNLIDDKGEQRESTLDKIIIAVEHIIKERENPIPSGKKIVQVGKHKVTLDEFMIAFINSREDIIEHPIFKVQIEALQEKMKREYLEDLQRRLKGD